MSESWVLCAGTIPRARFRERVDAAAEAGFAAITLFPEQYRDAVEREGIDPSAMHRHLQRAGIFVHQIDPLLDWYSKDASKSELRLCEAAEATRARSLNVAPAFAPTDDLAFLTDRLGALGERAAARGLSIDLEFLPWSPIPNLGAAISVVDACGVRTVGVMLDSWHFFRGGGQVSELTPDVVDRITGVQLNDAPLEPAPRGARERWDASQALLGWARNGWRTLGARDLVRLTRHAAQSASPELIGETLTRRLLPGEGELPVSELLAALKAGGCGAPVGVEVFNSELHRLPPREAARRAMQACLRVAPPA
jgi:sugar phosphate isomerase/epimerase